MQKLLFFLLLSVTIVSCGRKQKPKPLICFTKDVYNYKDTIAVNNCSENYTKIRWVLPDGVQTTAEKIYYVAPNSGIFKFTLYASNEDYVNEYEVVKYITVNP